MIIGVWAADKEGEFYPGFEWPLSVDAEPVLAQVSHDPGLDQHFLGVHAGKGEAEVVHNQFPPFS
jgi:hypothetical protein